MSKFYRQFSYIKLKWLSIYLRDPLKQSLEPLYGLDLKCNFIAKPYEGWKIEHKPLFFFLYFFYGNNIEYTFVLKKQTNKQNAVIKNKTFEQWHLGVHLAYKKGSF